MSTPPDSRPEIFYLFTAQFFFGPRHQDVLCRLQHASFADRLPDDEWGDQLFSLRRATPCGAEPEIIGDLCLMSHSLLVSSNTAEHESVLRAQIDVLLRDIPDAPRAERRARRAAARSKRRGSSPW